jgi:hypothetical protein
MLTAHTNTTERAGLPMQLPAWVRRAPVRAGDWRRRCLRRRIRPQERKRYLGSEEQRQFTRMQVSSGSHSRHRIGSYPLRRSSIAIYYLAAKNERCNKIAAFTNYGPIFRSPVEGLSILRGLTTRFSGHRHPPPRLPIECAQSINRVDSEQGLIAT